MLVGPQHLVTDPVYGISTDYRGGKRMPGLPPTVHRLNSSTSGLDVAADWRLRNGRVSHKVTPGYTDGFRPDRDGNVWCSAADGVHCIAPGGTKPGVVKVPFRVPNLAFGGHNRSRLSICASHALYAIYVD